MSDDGFVVFPRLPTREPLVARIVCDDHPEATPDIDVKDVVDDNLVETRWTRFTCSVCERVLTPEYL